MLRIEPPKNLKAASKNNFCLLLACTSTREKLHGMDRA